MIGSTQLKIKINNELTYANLYFKINYSNKSISM